MNNKTPGDFSSILRGGGEMAERTRAFAWRHTSLGSIDTWPSSLVTALNIILNSNLPMFLFWGTDHICFYNDAYRTRLSELKHPYILGKAGKDAWPEIWEILNQQIKHVLQGEEVSWHDDQLSIHQSGKIDFAYWRYSYAPLIDNTAAVVGVFVTCTDAAERVNRVVESKAHDEAFRRSGMAWSSDRHVRSSIKTISTKEADRKRAQHTGSIKSVIEQLPMAIAVLRGDDFVLELGNEKIFDFWGRPASITGMKLSDALPDVTDSVMTILASVYETGQPYHRSGAKSEWTAGGASTEKYFDFTYTPLYDVNNEIDGVVVIAAEVTSNFLAQEKIRQSEAEFRALIEQAPIATCLFVGPDLRIEVANKLMQDAWGKGDSVLGKQLFEAVPELADQPFIKIIQEVYRTGHPYEAKGQAAELVVDGVSSTYYFDFTYQPIRDMDGNVYAVMDMAVDVTDEVVAQIRMKQTEGLLQNAVDLADLAMWTIDLTTGVFSGSHRFREWLGYDEGEDMDQHALDFLTSDYKNIAGEIARAAEQHPSQQRTGVEHPVINRKTGQRRIIKTIGQIINDKNGRPILLRGTSQDITLERGLRAELEREVAIRMEEIQATNEELSSTNEELAESNQNLLHSNEELSQYAYVASHDLQEPLRKIRVFSERLASTPGLTAQNQDFLMRINKSSERMTLLIRDLLQFSRLLNSRDVYVATSLDDVLKNVVNDFELLIEEKKALISVSPLPTLEAVPLQMNQLFYNLIGNALKFSREGVQQEIRVASRPVNANELTSYMRNPNLGVPYYLITVSDNGIGFESKFAEKIFDVFNRLHGNEVYTGSGIGLALARRIVRNHGGVIVGDAKLNAGATFSIILPVLQSATRKSSRPPASSS